MVVEVDTKRAHLERHADYVMMETFIVLGLCVILYEALDLFQSCYRNGSGAADKEISAGAGATAPATSSVRAPSSTSSAAVASAATADDDIYNDHQHPHHSYRDSDLKNAHGRESASHQKYRRRLPLLLDTVAEGDCCDDNTAADNDHHIDCDNNEDNTDNDDDYNGLVDGDELLLIGGHRAQSPAANIAGAVYAISGAAVA